MIRAHLIHLTKGLHSRVTIEQVPRVGDELRLGEHSYYKVVAVVWVFDEPNSPYQRVNIGFTEIELGGKS